MNRSSVKIGGKGTQLAGMLGSASRGAESGMSAGQQAWIGFFKGVYQASEEIPSYYNLCLFLISVIRSYLVLQPQAATFAGVTSFSQAYLLEAILLSIVIAVSFVEYFIQYKAFRMLSNLGSAIEIDSKPDFFLKAISWILPIHTYIGLPRFITLTILKIIIPNTSILAIDREWLYFSMATFVGVFTTFCQLRYTEPNIPRRDVMSCSKTLLQVALIAMPAVMQTTSITADKLNQSLGNVQTAFVIGIEMIPVFFIIAIISRATMY